MRGALRMPSGTETRPETQHLTVGGGSGSSAPMAADGCWRLGRQRDHVPSGGRWIAIQRLHRRQGWAILEGRDQRLQAFSAWAL